MQKKSMTLPDFLTEAQIAKAVRLYEAHGHDAKAKIQAQIIEPNMATINVKLGQENDASYLAYAAVYVLSQASNQGCVARKHDDHIRDVCEGQCCTSCGGPIDENEECRC